MALGAKVVVYLRGKPILNGCLQGRIIGIKSGLAVFTTLTLSQCPRERKTLLGCVSCPGTEFSSSLFSLWVLLLPSSELGAEDWEA